MIEWTPGQKHPDTSRDVFMNCYEYDQVRRVLEGRCQLCDFVISSDERAIREIVYECRDSLCYCHDAVGSKIHRVCDLCYNVYRSLYVNYGMRSMNYFRNLDEKQKKDGDDRRRKDRLGL